LPKLWPCAPTPRAAPNDSAPGPSPAPATRRAKPPAEDAVALLAEAGQVLGELEALIRRINRTNAVTPAGDGTLTDALTRRDVLRLRHGVIWGSIHRSHCMPSTVHR
jgi:hypothetical protein